MSVSHAPPPRRSPPQPPRPSAPIESRIRRFKLAWRLFMVANLGLGAYMFATATLKSMKSERPPLRKGRSSRTPTAPTEELLKEKEFMPSVPIAKLVKEREPIPEDQQRMLFEWILEEKRKVKPMNKAEKKQIDEEKAILKQFIRAESVPRF